MASSNLTGKTFITGAGSAIASAINVAFLEAGANLALADRPGNAELAAKRLGPNSPPSGWGRTRRQAAGGRTRRSSISDGWMDWFIRSVDSPAAK